MLTPLRRHVLVQVARFYPIIDKLAREYSLDKWLVIGVIAQESAGNPYAVRVEPGFWRRYGREMIRQATNSPSKLDDKWMKFWQLSSCSYGLMQVMYQVACERGYRYLRYPTELCDPHNGIEAGCRHLSWCMGCANNDVTQALLRYNGGGDKTYPVKVETWAADARVSELFYLPREQRAASN